MKINGGDAYMDTVYHYKGKWGSPSVCGIKVVVKPASHIILATELYESNPGTSVAEFVANLAEMICAEYSLDPEKILFIERVPDRGSRLEHYRESFDIVRMDRIDGKFDNPRWEHVERVDIDAMIGVK